VVHIGPDSSPAEHGGKGPGLPFAIGCQAHWEVERLFTARHPGDEVGGGIQALELGASENIGQALRAPPGSLTPCPT
jgi:hypothetical protein